MNDKPVKKLKVKPTAPADYARYLAKIRAEAAERPQDVEKIEEVSGDPEIGDVMKDGTIYAGISPDTHEPMYAAPFDAPLSMHFNRAAEYAEQLEVGGKKDFRVPTKDELNVLFENREKGALKGTFNQTGTCPDGWYWSSVHSDVFSAWVQQFKDGGQNHYLRYLDSACRCVRG